MNNLKKKLSQDLKLKDKIIELYINQDKKKDEVAKELNLTLWTLSNLFKEFDIKKDKKAIVNKRKQTCIEKYEVDNPSKTTEIKEKIATKNKINGSIIAEKGKQTKLMRYGNSNYNNIKKIKLTNC